MPRYLALDYLTMVRKLAEVFLMRRQLCNKAVIDLRNLTETESFRLWVLCNRFVESETGFTKPAKPSGRWFRLRNRHVARVGLLEGFRCCTTPEVTRETSSLWHRWAHFGID